MWTDENLTYNTNRFNVIILAGHTAGAAATCTAAQTCTVCGETLEAAKGHADNNADAKCDACNVWIVPAVGQAFQIKIVQAKANKIFYFNGTVSGNYYGIGDINSAADVYLEEAEEDDGYYMYILDANGAKKYLYIAVSGTYFNCKLGDTKAVWVFNETIGTFTHTASIGTCYLGNYNDNSNDIRCSNISYVTGSNAANIGKTQFPALAVVVPEHECSYSDATCTVKATCAVCGITTGELAEHDWDDEATCTFAPTCLECGKVGVKEEHNYVNGTCSCGATENAAVSNVTITFDASKTNRTEYDKNHQVWEKDGVKFINNKANSSNDVGDYTNPVRIYANSTVTVEANGMTKVVIVSDGTAKYKTALETALTNAGIAYTASGSTYTLTFSTAVDTFTLTFTAQARFKSIQVNP